MRLVSSMESPFIDLPFGNRKKPNLRPLPGPSLLTVLSVSLKKQAQQSSVFILQRSAWCMEKVNRPPSTIPIKLMFRGQSEATSSTSSNCGDLNGEFILKYFSFIGVSKNGLPADPEQFALLVAKWQALQRNGKISVDGILGPATWAALKPLLATASVTTTSVQTPSRWLTLIKDTAICRAEPLLHGELRRTKEWSMQ